MKKKIYIYFLLFTAVLLFEGCFSVKREISFFPNGSGTEKITVTLDKALFDLYPSYVEADNTGEAKKMYDIITDDVKLNQWVTASMQKAAGTSIKNLLITDLQDGSKQIIIEYSFDEPNTLLGVIKETTYEFSNKLNVVFATLKFFLEDDNITFKHIIRNAKRSFSDSTALSIFSNLIQSSTVDYSIEFPFDITSSNAQSQADKTLYWQFPLSDVMFNQVEMTAEMKNQPGLELPYAEVIDRTLEKVDKNKNPLIRVQVYNANKEPVKIGTGIVVANGELVTNFKLMNLIEGQGYFSVILSNDSLAGIDEMHKEDLAPKWDLVKLRFNNIQKVKPLKYASTDVKYGTNVHILYYPNTLSSFVYSMNASITGKKKWNDIDVIEIKPSKPLSLDGGAAFTENGEFLGIITTAFNGEVGKIYLVPGNYIKTFAKE